MSAKTNNQRQARKFKKMVARILDAGKEDWENARKGNRWKLKRWDTSK